MIEIIDNAWKEYEGDVTVLNSAIGALVMGRHVGWQGIRVMYARATYNRYERILGIKFRDELPERGPDAKRLRGIRIIDGIGKFWQAISSGLISAKEAAQTA
jgi:hypothetical protein